MVEEKLDAARTEYARLGARIGGLTAEREGILAAIPQVGDESTSHHEASTTQMTKAQAIVEVLRVSSSPMRIAEIVTALKAGGRPNETYNGVSVYLDTLLKNSRVRRVSRGLYEAIS